MIIMVTGFRMLSEGVLDRVSEKAAARRGAAEAEARLRSLAAVAAVTVLRRDTPLPGSSEDADG